MQLVVIGQGSPFLTRQVCSEFEAWYHCVSDKERVSFSAYGLGYSSYGNILRNRKVGKGRRRANAKGYCQHMARTFQTSSDWLQLPGAALIDSEGIVRHYQQGKNVSDIPDLDAMLIAASALQ